MLEQVVEHHVGDGVPLELDDDLGAHAGRQVVDVADALDLPYEDARPAYEELGELTNGLPPKERAAVVLRYGYDLTYDQIATALDSSPVAARQAASAGVRHLRGKKER